MNILWDFDGTLFDTYPAYTDIMYDVLNGHFAKQEILAHLKNSFTHTVKFYGLSEQQIKKNFALEKELDPAETPPFPYVENVLKLADVNVMMTHKPRKEVLRILNYYNWTDYFTEIVAIDDGYPRKPNPSSYIYLNEKYRLDLVIGDREIDILPGHEIGIKTCLFQNRTPGADCYLDTYEDFAAKCLQR
ncbi:phosphoglycolate phosphatase [Paenibacillus sp. CCS19]|uniref:HAD-IA family hydrolase n=1 Tax=Paenibacillus sp. CCS19 TaxID=3158387 RepID=UPI0025620814|nr:HAD-IA family hydrolase [Paenibacillus cellulosilyticus]GMK39572.1 phosphoglycolate phosphatase [Paenibacillus cellulosilyticus]